MKLYRLAQETPEILYHGGHDIGEPAVLRSGYQGGKPSGQDAGGIFLTPSKPYAKQYMKHPHGLYQTTLPVGEKIFDISKTECIDQFIDGADNWEDYGSPEDARSDAFQMINTMANSAKFGAIDWGEASQFLENMQQSGFTGAKFLERPAEKIEANEDGSFKLSGEPVFSYVLFRKELPVTRSALDNRTCS